MPAIYQNGNWYGGKDYGHAIKDDGIDVNPRKNLDFVDFDLTDSAADDEIKIKPHKLTSNEVQDIFTEETVLSGSALLGGAADSLFPLGVIINFFGDVVPDGFLLCDGTEYNKSDYSDLSAYLLTISNDYEGTTNDKFKVPNLINKFIKGSAIANVGTNQVSGVPNIKGLFNIDWGSYPTKYASRLGCFNPIRGDISNSEFYGKSGNDAECYFDASRSSAIYGRSTTVIPENISILYCIKY